MKKVTLQMIKDARKTISDIINVTPIIESPKMNEETGANVFLKCENLQKTGSFKIRGACNKIANLTQEEKDNGVIASSAGNHAQGVALGAKMNGIEATIVMPATAPLAKVNATKGYGANVVLNGLVYDDAYSKAVEIQKETGATFLHPFDDEYVIAGQGTISLEIFEQLENVDTIICPIGGGGIISGVAVAAKAIKPDVKIVGVQTSNIPSMKVSLESGKVTSAFNDVTMADGIAVKTPGDLTFNTIKDLIDEIIVVDEEEIAQAIVFLLEYQKVIAEGAGAVSTAAIWSGKYKAKENENIVCIISGGNVDINTMYRIIDMGLNKCGRRFTFKTHIEDRAGGLSQVTSILREHNVNILNAHMSKMNSKYGIGKQLVELTIETFNEEHKNEIVNALMNSGFEVYIGE